MMGLYRLAGSSAAPALRAMLARRAAAAKEIPARLPERFGIPSQPRPPGRLVWIHAASVGETMSILPLIEALTMPVLLTTGTVTSARLAAERTSALHQFVPLDVPAWVAAFLDRWRPSAAVFVESELWPGILDACDSRGIPRLLVNARMSAKSATNWRRAGRFAQRVLAPFRYIHAQSAGDAAQLRSLGATDLLEWGNLKYAAAPLPADAAALEIFTAALGSAKTWLAASTHPGEDSVVAETHNMLRAAGRADVITIIAPRHPARGPEIAPAAPHRSRGEAPRAGEIYVADTLGELGLLFRATPFAFIGNSLPGCFGGHNIVEPARLGRPVIAGPHLENFEEPAALLRSAGALAEVTDAASLAAAAGAWLTDPGAAKNAGAAAAACFPETDLAPRLAALIESCALQ
jgi:3-deoxy-D-manno-octulosonic-acid transferase